MGTLVNRALLLLLVLAVTQSLSAADCSADKTFVAKLELDISNDQSAIKALGVNLTASDFDEWTQMAEARRNQILVSAALSLLDGILSVPDAAGDIDSIAGYPLKNGLASIGKVHANILTERIRAEGGVKLALIPVIQELGAWGR
jgi:hypothetical protein